MFHSLPMSRTRVRVESSKNANSIGDFRTSGNSKIHQSTDCTEIWSVTHKGNILRCGSTHRCVCWDMMENPTCKSSLIPPLPYEVVCFCLTKVRQICTGVRCTVSLVL